MNRCVSTINALPSNLRYGAVRARPVRHGAFAIEAELPCINGLSAWFTIAQVDAIDDSELLMTEGAIGSAKDIADAIATALSSPATVEVVEARRLARRLFVAANMMEANPLFPRGQAREDLKADLRALSTAIDAALNPAPGHGEGGL